MKRRNKFRQTESGQDKKRMKKVDSRLYLFAIRIFVLIIVLKGTILIPILIALSLAMSFIINNFPIRNIGIELATFVGVIIGREFGPLWGFAAGGLLVSFHIFAAGFFGMYVFWVIPIYAIAGSLGGIFGGNIVTIGIIATIFINVVEAICTMIFSPAYIVKHLPYAVTNIIFNITIFTLFANAISAIL